MTTLGKLAVLFAAALLEAGGDALIRKGLHASASLRIGFMAAGAVVLFAYGWVVNTPPWDFGRLIGVYVVFFFAVAQIINWLAFGQAPSARVVLGGACIIVGGLIISGDKSEDALQALLIARQHSSVLKRVDEGRYQR